MPQEATELAKRHSLGVEKEPQVVLETVRCTTHLGVYTAFEEGELLFKFGNHFSWFRHKRVETTLFKQHPWDFDPSDEDEDEHENNSGAVTSGGQQLTLQVAAGPLRDAILKRNIGICRQIISGGSDPTMLANLYWDPAKRFTLLHYAAAQNAVPFAQLLLANGARPDVQSLPPHGFTPLFLAASHGFLEVVKMLVEAGADIEIPAVRPPQKPGCARKRATVLS